MPLLTSCSLLLTVQHGPPWANLGAALARQAQALGIAVENGPRLPPSQQAQDLILQARLQIGATGACAELQLQAGIAGALDEESLQAACGLLAVHARARQAYSPLGLPYLSCFAANLSLNGLLAALLGKLRGQTSTLGISNICISSIWHTSLLALTQYLAAARAGGDDRDRSQSADSNWHGPPFQSADGVWFELEVLTPEPWHAFCQALDLTPPQISQSWRAFMLRYAQARAPLPPAFSARLRSLPAQQIAQLAQQHGITYCPLQAASPSARHTPCAPWQFHPAPSPLSALPPLSATSLSANPALPLQGLRVIESCRRIQGPLAGFLLAELGADVLRLEPPGCDPLRAMPPLVEIAGTPVSARFAALNYNKGMEEVDLKSAAGQARVGNLARHAHVFLHNWGPGKAAEFKLERSALHAINPQLLYAWAGGWQDPHESMPGTDFVVQARSGVAALVRHANGAPGGSLFTMLDLLGGVLAAQGICAALLARQCAARGAVPHMSHMPPCGGSDSSLEAAAMVLLACAEATTAPQNSVPVNAQSGAPALCTDLYPLSQLLLNDAGQLRSCWNFV